MANPDYIPAGDLAVAVTDLVGQPVSGADLQVFDGTDSFVWAHGVSGGDGVVTFNSPPTRTIPLLAGSYRATLTAPAGYVVASTQANPVIVQISDKRTTSISMKVTKSP
jgi:hypothetical protein